jgi:hypothetical protein
LTPTGFSPLYLAAEARSEAILSVLLARGAAPDGGYDPAAGALAPAAAPIWWAVRHGSTRAVRALIDANATVNFGGLTPAAVTVTGTGTGAGTGTDTASTGADSGSSSSSSSCSSAGITGGAETTHGVAHVYTAYPSLLAVANARGDVGVVAALAAAGAVIDARHFRAKKDAQKRFLKRRARAEAKAAGSYTGAGVAAGASTGTEDAWDDAWGGAGAQRGSTAAMTGAVTRFGTKTSDADADAEADADADAGADAEAEAEAEAEANVAMYQQRLLQPGGGADPYPGAYTSTYSGTYCGAHVGGSAGAAVLPARAGLGLRAIGASLEAALEGLERRGSGDSE